MPNDEGMITLKSSRPALLSLKKHTKVNPKFFRQVLKEIHPKRLRIRAERWVCG